MFLKKKTYDKNLTRTIGYDNISQKLLNIASGRQNKVVNFHVVEGEIC